MKFAFSSSEYNNTSALRLGVAPRFHSAILQRPVARHLVSSTWPKHRLAFHWLPISEGLKALNGPFDLSRRLLLSSGALILKQMVYEEGKPACHRRDV